MSTSMVIPFQDDIFVVVFASCLIHLVSVVEDVLFIYLSIFLLSL